MPFVSKLVIINSNFRKSDILAQFDPDEKEAMERRFHDSISMSVETRDLCYAQMCHMIAQCFPEVDAVHMYNNLPPIKKFKSLKRGFNPSDFGVVTQSLKSVDDTEPPAERLKSLVPCDVRVTSSSMYSEDSNHELPISDDSTHSEEVKLKMIEKMNNNPVTKITGPAESHDYLKGYELIKASKNQELMSVEELMACAMYFIKCHENIGYDKFPDQLKYRKMIASRVLNNLKKFQKMQRNKELIGDTCISVETGSQLLTRMTR